MAPQWDFAGGSTSSGLLDLSLYNPTAAQAVVDVSFLTPSGSVLEPQAYQGITLAPGQLEGAKLGDYVQNQAQVATLVQASSGDVVATELDELAVPSGARTGPGGRHAAEPPRPGASPRPPRSRAAT